MKYKLSHIQSASILLTYCLAYVLFFVDVMTIYKKNIYSPLYLLGIPALLCLFKLFDVMCTRITTFITLHFLLGFGLIFIPLPSPIYRILYFFLLIVETCRDYYLWTRGGYKPYRSIPWILISFVSLSYLCSVIYHEATIMTLSYFVGLGIISLHFVRLTISGLNSQFTQPGNTTNIPVRKIIFTNTTIMAIFVLTFVLASLFIHLFDLEFLLYDIGKLLANILRLILESFLYVVAFLRALFAKNTEAVQEKEQRNQNMMDAFQTAANPSLLSRILSYAGEIAAFVILIYIIYRIVSNTMKTYMTKHILETDEITVLEHQNEHVLKKTKTKNKTLREILKTDAVSQVRQAYRSKIRSYKKIKPNTYDTSSDLNKRVTEVYSENINTLTEVYQKARYSNNHITKEDITKATTFSTNKNNNNE